MNGATVLSASPTTATTSSHAGVVGGSVEAEAEQQNGENETDEREEDDREKKCVTLEP
jgi:hypothetical protein